MDRRRFIMVGGLAASAPALAGAVSSLAAPAAGVRLSQRVDFVSDGLGLEPREYAALLGEAVAAPGFTPDYYSNGGAVEQLERQFASLLARRRRCSCRPARWPTTLPYEHWPVQGAGSWCRPKAISTWCRWRRGAARSRWPTCSPGLNVPQADGCPCGWGRSPSRTPCGAETASASIMPSWSGCVAMRATTASACTWTARACSTCCNIRASSCGITRPCSTRYMSRCGSTSMQPPARSWRATRRSSKACSTCGGCSVVRCPMPGRRLYWPRSTPGATRRTTRSRGGSLIA